MVESAAARLESKVDVLVSTVAKQEQAISRLTDQLVADKRLTDQLLGFMQQAIDRIQSEVDEERGTRKDGDDKIEGRLSRIGYALFTALLALIGSGLALVLFTR